MKLVCSLVAMITAGPVAYLIGHWRGWDSWVTVLFAFLLSGCVTWVLLDWSDRKRVW